MSTLVSAPSIGDHYDDKNSSATNVQNNHYNTTTTSTHCNPSMVDDISSFAIDHGNTTFNHDTTDNSYNDAIYHYNNSSNNDYDYIDNNCHNSREYYSDNEGLHGAINSSDDHHSSHDNYNADDNDKSSNDDVAVYNRGSDHDKGVYHDVNDSRELENHGGCVREAGKRGKGRFLMFLLL